MDASLWIAKTGLDAQQTRMSVIANNLANVNTIGFKQDRASFEDMLYQNLRKPGSQIGANAQSPTGLMLGTGVRLVSTQKTHTQGSLVTTKNALDMLRWIEKQPHTINAAIVANCSQETVDIICSVVPELKTITKWCLRDLETHVTETMIDNMTMTKNPKNNIYERAITMYYQQEHYVIGFANTYVGYNSLSNITPIIYFYIDENETSNCVCERIDAFIFDDYRSVYDAV